MTGVAAFKLSDRQFLRTSLLAFFNKSQERYKDDPLKQEVSLYLTAVCKTSIYTSAPFSLPDSCEAVSMWHALHGCENLSFNTHKDLQEICTIDYFYQLISAARKANQDPNLDFLRRSSVLLNIGFDQKMVQAGLQAGLYPFSSKTDLGELLCRMYKDALSQIVYEPKSNTICGILSFSNEAKTYGHSLSVKIEEKSILLGFSKKLIWSFYDTSWAGDVVDFPCALGSVKKVVKASGEVEGIAFSRVAYENCASNQLHETMTALVHFLSSIPGRGRIVDVSLRLFLSDIPHRAIKNDIRTESNLFSLLIDYLLR